MTLRRGTETGRLCRPAREVVRLEVLPDVLVEVRVPVLAKPPVVVLLIEGDRQVLGR